KDYNKENRKGLHSLLRHRRYLMEKWLEEAKMKDGKDALGHFRDEFYIGEDVYYMDGNSLGLMSKRAEQSLLDVMDDWKHHGIDGWVKGERPWFYMSEAIGEKMAQLIGAGTHEVLATNSTTNNIHQTVRTLYEPTEERYRIMAD